ncbi:MAG TPA: DNA-3-methyladenine glycosylase, partial [Thermoanaerobaculia bacterium]|nr:DNA-3-methyladenine glycosylase [Thermoanaerobaculia bacterium]
LLGTRLVRTFPDGSTAALVVVETEAYLGVEDRAAHTFGGRRTARVQPMWGPGGHAYVYSIYGMHHCLNVVTREEGTPQAVLVRAAVPEAWWRGELVPKEELLASSGPGRLCRELALTRADSGASLSGPLLRLTAGPPRAFEILVGPRVGVDYAGEAALWPLRFAVAGCPAVTARRTLAPLNPPAGPSATPPSRRSSSRSASPGREPGRRAR